MEFLAAFWHELVLVKTCVVKDGVLFALVEVIKRKRTFVGRSSLWAIASSSNMSRHG